MTIIAFRDGVMASDGRCVQGWTVISDRQRKIFKLDDGSLVGGTGRVAIIGRYCEWLSDRAKERPSLHDTSDPKESASTVLVALFDGTLELHSVAGIERLEGEFHAYGSGQDLALGAMEMGASAEQAVGVAILRSMGCGGQIASERLG